MHIPTAGHRLARVVVSGDDHRIPIFPDQRKIGLPGRDHQFLPIDPFPDMDLHPLFAEVTAGLDSLLDGTVISGAILCHGQLHGMRLLRMNHQRR